jgi:hypothetical protein
MVAQTSPDQTGPLPGANSGTSGSPAGQVNPANNEETLQGCLMGSAGHYTLTDSSGVQFKLTGNTSRLSSHLEHQIEVKGKTADKDTTGSASTGSQGTGTAMSGGTPQVFHVSKVTKISDACSAHK